MSQIVRVTRHFQVQFDGHLDDYVWTADQYSQAKGWGQLDSYDAGDATGLWVRAAAEELDKGVPFIYYSPRRHPDGTTMCLITVTAEDDLFIWAPPLPEVSN